MIMGTTTIQAGSAEDRGGEVKIYRLHITRM